MCWAQKSKSSTLWTAPPKKKWYLFILMMTHLLVATARAFPFRYTMACGHHLSRYVTAAAFLHARRRRGVSNSNTSRPSSTQDDDSTHPASITSTLATSADDFSKISVTPSKRVRKGVGLLLSALGFASSTLTTMWTDREQFQRWNIDSLRSFLNHSGIALELSDSLNVRLLDNMIILARVQRAANTSLNGRDRRDLVLCDTVDESKLPSEEESLRYMRYATAVYGEAMIRAAEMDVAGVFDNRVSTLTRTRISEHIGVPENDIVLLDVDHGGDLNHLRHFVAVDHENRKVVLAIRGTFSVSEVFVDVAGFSRAFCGGEAHAEMSNMAERVWNVTGETVLALLRENEGYDFVITGHSLGAGTACLLHIMCHENQRELIEGRNVRCFAYATPPVFYPLESVPEAVESCTSYIHGVDMVPFLSVDSVRHLFAAVRSIEEQNLGWRSRMRLITGRRSPDDSLIQAVRRANEERLLTKPGAPLLVIPAARTLWLRETSNGRFDYRVCDPRKLATLGIYLDPTNMLQDHFPPRYEHALHHLE